MNHKLLGLSSTAVFLCHFAQAQELSVPLKVTEPVGIARINAPVSGGIPIGPLKATNCAELALIDEHGLAVAAHLSPMVTLEDGTLAWVLADFVTDLKPGESKAYNLRRSVRSVSVPLKTSGVTVRSERDGLVLDNDILSIRISTNRFDLFESVRMIAGELLDPARPPAFTITRVSDRSVFTPRDGRVERVALEDSGPVRSTVRLDGTYGDGKGNEWLKYTARITMWSGSTDVKVLYTIRNVNPSLEDMAHIREASVQIKLAQTAPAANYVVGAARPHFSRLSRNENATSKGSQWHNAVELMQVGPCEPVCSKSHRRFHHLVDYEDAGYRVRQYQPADRKPVVDVGFWCDGWLYLEGDRGGCQIWLRSFAEDNPKRLSAAVDGTMRLDLIPVHEGTGQPYYAEGGYWLGDRSHRTYEVHFIFLPQPVVTAEDVKKWDAEFDNYQPFVGAGAETLSANVQRARNVLQLVSTPEWYTRTGEMWGVVPSLLDEEAAARAMGRSVLAPPPPLDAGERLATEYIHYENFHYRSEWDAPGDALLEFLRTGEWHFLRRAHSYARNYRDLGVPRTDGLTFGPRPKGVTNKVGAVERWGKFCDCHNYGAGLLDMWLVTGDRSYRDAGVEFGYDIVRRRRGGGFGNRDWGRHMTAVLRTWMVTRDPTLKKWLVQNCRPPTPDDALRADGRALICGKHMASWMVGGCSHAIWHNWVLNQQEYTGIEYDDYRDQIIGMARQVAKYWWFEGIGGPYHFDFDAAGPGKVTTEGGGGPYTLSCVDMITRGYLLTGDYRLLEAAKKFWDAFNGPDKSIQKARLQEIGMGSTSFWARQLVYELAHPRKDGLPPQRVTDLRAEVIGQGRIKLSWTAPKDEGGGQVVVYQIKHAPRPIVTYEEYDYPRDHNQKWTWWGAYNVSGEPRPGEPGTPESMVIENLPTGPRYLALCSRDELSLIHI
ncbi:MAG: hypothetical protein N2255_08645, partial [Kiritimatiellae bacterium]|nr:hypothetical protein [Kiritimatiellia bacterium]